MNAKSEVVRAEVEEPTSILAVISRAAQNPDVDVDKMERLFALQERMVARQAEAEFNVAMRNCQEEMPRVRRDAENESTKSTYARLETLNAAIVPVVTKHGFSMSFGTADSPLEGHVRITCLVSHVGGHSRQYQCDVPLDMTGMKGNQNKTATHAFGSTVSYGRRYLTLLIFNVSLTNEDKDGVGDDRITEEQVADLEALITEVGANRPFFLRYCKVDSLEEIRAKHYGKAVAALQAKRKQ